VRIFNRNNIPSIVRDNVQDGRDQVEIQREKLRKNPDRIILGRELETEKYANTLKSKYWRIPFLVGDSGAGKDIVLQSFAQRVAMAQLWEDNAFRDMVLRNYPEAVPYYETADRMMDTDALRYKRVFIIDGVALEADSSKRVQQIRLLGEIRKAIIQKNSLFVINDAVNIVMSDSEPNWTSNKFQLMLMLKHTHRQPHAKFGMIDTTRQFLALAISRKFPDYIRRMDLIEVNTHDPKTVLRIMKGRYVQGSFEDTYKVHSSDGAVEAATRLGIHIYGRSPGFPMYTAYTTLEGAIVFALGEGKRELTENGVYEYLETKRSLKLDRPDRVGRDTMELGAEHFMSPEMKELENLRILELRRAKLSPSDIEALSTRGAVANGVGIKRLEDEGVNRKRRLHRNKRIDKRTVRKSITEFIFKRRR
jgi:hypothetical protein